jgi:FkbM family methyltransferase
MTLEEDKKKDGEIAPEDDFDQIFKDLFKDQELDKKTSKKKKLDSEDALLDDLLTATEEDQEEVSLNQEANNEEKSEEDFQWLEDLIKDLDTKDNQEEPLVPALQGSASTKGAKKSFLSKIGNKPRAPAPPPNVVAYASGKKVVVMESQEEEAPQKKIKFFVKKIKITPKKILFCVMGIILVASTTFAINFFNNTKIKDSNIILKEVYGGDKILIDLKMTSKSGYEVIEKGYLDSQVSNLMYQLIKPGDKVLDIGAGFGYYSLYLARLVGSQGKVFSFEARDKVFKLLEASIAINKFTQITPIQALLFSDKIKVLVNESDKNHRSKFGLINIELDNKNLYNNNLGSFLAETSKLDDLVPIDNISLININASGTEMNILLGAKKILAYSPKVKIITTWSKNQMSHYINLKAMIQQLLSNDFKFWLIKPSNGTLIPLTSLDQIMQVERARLLIAKTLN